MQQARRDAVPEYHGIGNKLIGFAICVMVAGFVFAQVLTIWQAASAHFQGAAAGKALASCMIILSTLFGLCLWTFYTRPQQRRSARFRRAVRTQAGAGVPLVEPQPALSLVLPFPATVRLRYRWPVIVMLSTVISMLIGLFVLVEWYLMDAERTPSIAIFVAVGFGLLTLASGVVGIGLNAAPAIEVTSESFSYFVADTAQTVLWAEADLFAIVDGGRNHPHAVIYELASPAATIRWKRLCRPSPFAIHQPAEPFDVYEQRMNALLGFIAARTGLPLYDLR